MYLPTQFNETRTEVLQALMRARPLTTLVTLCDSGIVANHLPVQTLHEPAPLGIIRGHVARANPLWRECRIDTQVLAIFHGPDVYVSPSFYPSKANSGEVVPTWDYAVVHAAGWVRFIEDTEWLRSFVSGLTDSHEMSRTHPWKMSDAPADYIDKMLKLIVGFEISITSLAGKWKVSQNRPQADREGVIRNLQAADDVDSQEIAAMLQSHDAGPGSPLVR